MHRIAASRYYLLFSALLTLSGLTSISSESLAQTRPPYQLPVGVTEADYAPGMVVVKMRSALPTSSSQARTLGDDPTASSVRVIQDICGATRISPIIAPVGPLRPQARTAPHPLSTIYKIETDESDVVAIVRQLEQLEEVIYAEPYYLLKPLDAYTPNDPSAQANGGEQDYLATVHAYEAWAIERGNKDVLVGILDTGVEFGHQDLTDNLYVNSADPINGIDDDGDGYTDNYVGWDMADHDNDPTADQNNHGTLVAGVAAATPDNGVGIAGLGFHSSYMPIKIFRSGDGAFAFGYEAIAYAADRGCKVINLSWGGANAYSRFGEEIINYAVLEKDAVVIAAAGNSGEEEKFYPASYDRVLSVAITDADDNTVAKTTHNHWIDLVAPGSRNYTTRNQDGYSYTSGSSFSAPLVSGAAALVRARYPRWSAMQVMQQLRLSADDIYKVGNNRDYHEKLGRGRLNAARALQNLRTPALRVESLAYANHTGAYAYYGDTLSLHATFKNYLSSATNVSVTLSCISDYVTVLDSTVYFDRLDSLKEATHADRPFRVLLHDNLPTNEELVFRLGFTADAYQDYQYVSIVSSSEYATLDNGLLTLSVGSNGDVGYNPTATYAEAGLQQQQQTLAPQVGLLLATDADHVSDNVIQSYRTQLRSQDFVTQQPIKFYPSSVGTQTLRSTFTDAAAPQPLGVTIEQTWVADSHASRQPFLVGEYRVTNSSDATLSDLQTGLFADWNLSDANADRAHWDATHRLGYVYSSEAQYSGIALLTDQSPIYRAIDRQGLNGNTADTEGEYTDLVKYQFLSQGVGKTEAGVHGAGNDVAHLVGATLPTLATRQATQIAFALVVGQSLAELQQAVQDAQRLYDHHQDHPYTLLTVPVCAGQTATVQVPSESVIRFYQDARGTQLLAEGASYKTGAITADTAVYVASVRDGYESAIRRVAIRITEPVAQFTMDAKSNEGVRNDTLFLDESDNHTVGFWDESAHAVAWQWDFGNGFQSTSQHPVTRFAKTGRYTVTLTATSGPGCTSQRTRTITVVRRANRPVVGDRTVCPGSSVTLQANNTSQIEVYEDEALTRRLFTGSTFVSDPMTETSEFFVVNVVGAIPSVAQAVQVYVAAPTVTLHYALDTVANSHRYGLRLQALGSSSAISDLAWYVDNVYVSGTPEFVYDFSAAHAAGASVRVVLEYTQNRGELTCTYRLSEEVRLAPSPVPNFSAVRLCRGESTVLQPTNGTLFYFYQDEQRDSLIHKGPTLELNEVTESQTYYVTNMSGFLESDPVAVQIKLNSFADFSMSADTLYLSETNEAVFEAFAKGSSEAVSWQWDLGDGEVSHRAQRVTQHYDSTGTYQIRLLAQTAEGCTNTVTRTLVVERVTGLRKDQEEEAFRLYPNPTSGEVRLENRFWLQKNISLRLLTIQGQEVARRDTFYHASPLSVDLHQMASAPLTGGLYLLQVRREGRVLVRKVYLHH